jgi:hypothetical protein
MPKILAGNLPGVLRSGILNNRGLARRGQRDLVGAIADLEQAPESNPGLWEARDNLVLLRTKGKIPVEEGVAVFSVGTKSLKTL